MRLIANVIAMEMALCLTVVQAAAPVNVAGPWQFTIELSMGTSTPVVTFKQDGEKLTGTYEGRYGKSTLEGTVKDNQIEFTLTIVAEGTPVSAVFAGVYEAGAMKGNVEYEGAGDGIWTATRLQPAK
jgi:hypothetical protein